MNHVTTIESFLSLSRAGLAAALSVAFGACQSRPPEPEPVPKIEVAPARTAPAGAGAAERSAAPKQATAIVSSPIADSATAHESARDAGQSVVAVGGGDPFSGRFGLAGATTGLSDKGKLVAEIHTAKGTLDCELYEDKAPITVANFVGLARGLRPFKDSSGNWVKKAGYDGTTFHRVIKGFMIQGGDPAGTGAGEPGYTIVDEIWPGAKHDQRGLLCMANRGKDTNGMQFFITDGAPAHLDGGYTIFGKCQPDSVIEALASVPVRGDSAIDPPKIEKIVIRRGNSKKKTPRAAAK